MRLGSLASSTYLKVSQVVFLNNHILGFSNNKKKTRQNSVALILFTFQGNSSYGNMGSGLAGGYDSDAEAGLANQMGGGFGEKAVRLFIFARSSNPDPIFFCPFLDPKSIHSKSVRDFMRATYGDWSYYYTLHVPSTSQGLRPKIQHHLLDLHGHYLGLHHCHGLL